MKILPGLVFVFALAVAGFGQNKKDGFEVMPKEQAEIIQKWAQKFSYYRLAVESDCNEQDLAEVRESFGTLYYPYYKSGDFNRDGRDDFAIALIDKRRAKNIFDVAIFNGKNGDVYSPLPTYLSKEFDLSKGGLFFGYANSVLNASPFFSDAGTLFVFVKGKYVEQAAKTP